MHNLGMTKKGRKSRPTTSRRHEKVISIFDDLYAKKEGGARVHTFEYCVHETARLTDYSPATVRNIINLR